MKNYLILICFSSLLFTVSSQMVNEKSLLNKLNSSSSSDQKKVDELNELSRFYIYYLPQNSPSYSNKALKIAVDVNYLDGIADSYLNLGFYSFRIDDYYNSEKYYKKAIEYYVKTNNKIGIGSCYQLMARTSNGLGNYEYSMDLLLRAHKIFEDIDYTIGIGRVFETIGDINDIFGDYSTALENLTYSIEIKEQNKDFLELSRSYAYLGNVFNHLGDNDKALENFNKALKLSRITYNLNSESYTLTKLGDFYFELKDYDQSIGFYKSSLEITKLHSNFWGKIRNLQGIGKDFFLKKDYSNAVFYLKNSIESAKNINDKEGLMNSYELMYNVYQDWDSINQAFANYKLYTLYKDSLYNRKKASNISMLQNKYNQEIILKEKNASELVNYLVTGILLMALAFVILLFKRLTTTRKQKKIVEDQKNILQQKNIEITDSITYAKKIQEAILTSDEYITEHLSENFIYYNPKDLVSGDFYWVYAKEDYVFFSVFDCTGHGVPGALMSMIGNSLLNEMIVERKLLETNEILDAISDKVKKSFYNQGQENQHRDGMDMVLCRLNKKTNELMYSGANNSLFLISKGELVEYKGDRRPVGFYLDKGILFTSLIIELKDGDAIYLYSDGFTDQFGGERNRKYKSKNLKEFLLSISDRNMLDQGRLISEEFARWKGENDQLDDVCVMGVRI